MALQDRGRRADGDDVDVHLMTGLLSQQAEMVISKDLNFIDAVSLPRCLVSRRSIVVFSEPFLLAG